MNIGSIFYRLKDNFKGKLPNADFKADLVVPFQMVGNDEVYVYRAPIQFFATKLIKVSPQVINLRSEPKLEKFTSRIVVTDRRGGSSQLPIEFQLVRRFADGRDDVVERNVPAIRANDTSNATRVYEVSLKREWFPPNEASRFDYFMRVIGEDSSADEAEVASKKHVVDVRIVLENF